ncbi:MAG: TetR/AcrR family transcriptional regulator [bacterium]|nr:TetR/AcrR family transcriptional regulator [bacterium]
MIEDSDRSENPTRQRILDGARDAVALHGVSKLGMADVCRCAGMSRGTLYRYFGSREELLLELSRCEAERFRDRVLEAARSAPTPEARLHVLLEQSTRQVQEHPALQRLLESDPGRVLRALREQFGTIREEIHEILAPVLEATAPVRSGVVEVDQLVDWFTRILVTAYIIPDPDPEKMLEGLSAMHRMLSLGGAPDVIDSALKGQEKA